MQNFNLHFTLHLTQDKEQTKTSYDAAATFIEKDGTCFLFFDETNEKTQVKTKCRFEINGDSLRMRRNGPIVVEQTHARGQKTQGYIQTPFGQIDTALHTHHFSFLKQDDTTFKIILHYEMQIGLEQTRTYHLEMTIKELITHDRTNQTNH